MIISTLCYIEKDNKYLMLHRTKKVNDINKDKWIGIGGKLEIGESPEECIMREVNEETGLILKSYNLRCIVTTYFSDLYETEYMYVYTSNNFTGELIQCNEGDLQWIDKKELYNLNIWKGDKLFIDKIQRGDPFFSIKIVYNGNSIETYKITQY